MEELKIETLIYTIRSQKVMLDSDLAKLYEVSTKQLNQQIARNLERFPEDFAFKLSFQEFTNLRSQIVTSSLEHGGSRYAPYVFTENGVAMLSSVLRSQRAIQINIAIMRIFTRLRSFQFLEQNLRNEVSDLKTGTEQLFKVVFERLDDLENLKAPALHPNRKKIGIKDEI